MNQLRLVAFVAAFLVIITSASAQQGTPRRAPEPRPAATKSSAGTLDYVNGLEALEAGDYPRAVASFTRAIEADDDNANYHLARGVANTLAEQFRAALADLERVQRLRPADREAGLWLESAYVMGNPHPRTSCFVYGADVPAGYADLVCNRMAMVYWQSRTDGTYFDRETKRRIRVTAPVKASFPDAAREFVARHKTSGAEAGDVLLSRMKGNFERGDCAAAMKDLIALRRSAPDNTQLRAYWSSCLLSVGDVLHARKEFTRTLTIAPFWAAGYLGRAEAAAALGDDRRAASDLEVAAALRAPSLDAVKQRVAALVRSRPPGDAAERFTRAASADESWNTLVAAAADVHRWMNGRRQRYDEAYQDRIRLLNEAVRDDGKNADPYEMLARFLYRHRDVPMLWNGPRGGGEQARPQSPAEHQYELTHGLELVNEGLKVNGRHANSMATKALILLALNRGGEAARVVDEGLAIEGKNVRLLRLKAESLAAAAGALASQASGLRAGHTQTHREQRSDGEYEVTTHYAPSAADLRQAAGLEAEAAALQQEGSRLANEASQVESEIIPALVKTGEAKLAAGDAQAARRAFEQVYAYDPDAHGLMADLAQVFKGLGETRRERLYAMLAEPLQHTTAADALKTAWQEATRTAWKGAVEALDRAAAADAADPRTPAYRSVVAAGAGDVVGAQRQRFAALALDEARARLMRTTFTGENGGPIAVGDIGLTLAVRLDVGRAFAANRQYDRAAQAFAANVALASRLGKDDLPALVPSAMLPDPSAASNSVPVAPSVASLLAWSRLESGRALLATGKLAEARREYLAVRGYAGNWPSTATGRETMYVVDSWAHLGLAELAFAAGDQNEALRLLAEGFPGNLPADLKAELGAFTQKVTAARPQRGSWGPPR